MSKNGRICYTKIGQKLFNVEKSPNSENSLPSELVQIKPEEKDHTRLHKVQLMGLQRRLNLLFQTKTIEKDTKNSNKENLQILKKELLVDLGNAGTYSKTKAQKMAKNMYNSIGKGANLLMQVSKGKNYLLRINELQEKEEYLYRKRKEKINMALEQLDREKLMNQ